jgi:hypothetical protein
MSNTRNIRRLAPLISGNHVINSTDYTKNPSPNSYEHARKFGYEQSFHIIQYLINECENTKLVDERTKIIEKLFNYLIQNPTILIYQPVLRSAVIYKMSQLETYIQKRYHRFNQGKYDEAIKMMNVASDIFICDKEVRLEISNQLGEINNTLNRYKNWAKAESLLDSFSKLKIILRRIKNEPGYVSTGTDSQLN